MLYVGGFMSKNVFTYAAALFSVGLSSTLSFATDPAVVASALRMSNTLTGGSLPTNSPEFQSMVTSITSNDYYGAALTAIQSNYGSNYLLRRLALQMQNPLLDASIVNDSDASAFILAHFSGTTNGGMQTLAPSISKIWSDNLTCAVKVTRGGVLTTVKVADMTNAEKAAADWKSSLTCVPGQTVVDSLATAAATAAAPMQALTVVNMTLPTKHVGGYLTLSDRPEDTSFAQYGATAGTNLRFITGMWEIATGMEIIAFASAEGRAQNVPRFVPENDTNFFPFKDQGQTACISCHAGGSAALNHGYATIADLFNFNANMGGFQYYTAQATGTRKSLGSDAGKRQSILTCNMTSFTECNQDSVGVGTSQSWDLAPTWGSRGLLNTMDWQGATTGQGLSTLGVALGKAGIVFKNLTLRIQREICPLGALPTTDLNAIAAVGQSSDDIRQMIAQLASNPACR